MPFAHYFSVLAGHLESLVTHGGYVILFLFTSLEGIPLLGMAIPGHISIIMAGFLAKVGALNLCWVIVISVIGAILGDYIGFFIGRKYGMSFIDRLRPYFFVTEAHIEKAKALLARHTGKAMIIGRFTPATRALMPFLVGTGETPARKFWFFNVIGGVSWALISILIGYAFGAGYHAAAGYLGRFVVIAIIAGIIIVWGYRFVNMRFHIFRRYELFALALNLLSLWTLARIVQNLTGQSFRLGFDVWVNESMDALHHSAPLFASIAAGVSMIGGTAVTGGLGFLVGIWFAFKRKWRSAAIMILSISSTGLILGVLKEFFMSPRPANALELILNDPSFPSGHAGMSAAFFTAAAYLIAPRIHSWVKRELFILFCVVATIAVGLSRIVLNVHWATDVIAGWALGVFLATASILFVRYVGTLLVNKARA